MDETTLRRELKRILETKEGRALLSMLQNQDPAALSAAGSALRTGDEEGARQAMAGLLADPKARALLQKLGGSGRG